MTAQPPVGTAHAAQSGLKPALIKGGSKISWKWPCLLAKPAKLSLLLLACVPVVGAITFLLSKSNAVVTAKALDAQAAATTCAEESITFYRQFDKPARLVRALMLLSGNCTNDRDPVIARSLAEEAVTLSRTLDLPYLLADALELLHWEMLQAVGQHNCVAFPTYGSAG